MKLRNKKTGEIKSIEEIIRDALLYNELDSLKSIDANWEYYIPAEPYIKDEKIRKAVRAWAEVNDFEPDCKVRYGANSYSLFSSEASIEFNIYIKGLEHLKDYTIKELCGEEEE